MRGEGEPIGYIAHAADKACAHANKEGADLFGRAGHRAKAHQAKGAGYRHSGAYVAIHKHDDCADDCWQQGQSGAEGSRYPTFKAIGRSQYESQHKRAS